MFHRVLSYHPLFSYYSSMTFSILLSVLSTHILMTLMYLALLQVFLHTPKPETCKWLMYRRHRAPNFWSFLNFRLGQRKPCVVQCLKNSIPSSVHSTTIFSTSMTHTCPPFLHWTSLGYPLLRLLTGSFITFLLLNQLPRSSVSCVVFTSFSPPTSCWLCTGVLSALSASHVWGGFTHTELLNKIESKAFRLIDSPLLTDCLQLLTLHRNAASLAIIYRYFHANCSSELADCMPLTLLRPCHTRFSIHLHPYSVHQPYAKVNQYLHSFFPSTGKLWNSLPESVFPSFYDLNSFKRGVSRHLQPEFGISFWILNFL